MLVVCSIMGVILGAAFLAFNTVTTNANSLTVQTTLSNDSNNVMDTVSREIRQAQEVTEGDGAFLSANGNDISFYSNIDASGTPELVRYYREGNSFKKLISKSTIAVSPYNFVAQTPVVIISDLSTATAPIFRFYTSDSPSVEVISPTAANVNSISMVGISLLTQEALQGTTIAHTSATMVKIRCMFDSLN